MQNILILIGSPRRKGNSVEMADMLMTQLEEKDFHSQMLFLYDHDIASCLDCRACKKGGKVCTVKDGMQDLYAYLEEADLLVFGNPIYWFGPTAKTKLLVDRLRPYYGNKKLAGKKAALLLPAGSGAGDCDLTVEMFRRTFKALGIEFLGAAFSKAYDAGDAGKDPQTAGNIRSLASEINRKRPTRVS
jgi:multimeric flavodoxin WrbA